MTVHYVVCCYDSDDLVGVSVLVVQICQKLGYGSAWIRPKLSFWQHFIRHFVQ